MSQGTVALILLALALLLDDNGHTFYAVLLAAVSAVHIVLAGFELFA